MCVSVSEMGEGGGGEEERGVVVREVGQWRQTVSMIVTLILIVTL